MLGTKLNNSGSIKSYQKADDYIHFFNIFKTYLDNVVAKFVAFSSSRFVVGSSNAKTAQSVQNVSARAIRIMIEAKTCYNIEIIIRSKFGFH